jgi:endonuclease/exonuclease/phosphatase (EEP) superfamily protein YafD
MKALGSLFRVLIVGYVLALTGYLALRVVFGGDLWWLALLNNFAPYFFVPLVGLVLLALVSRLNVRFVLLPLLLLVVGMAWFGPRFAPRPQAAPAEAPLKVVTFNLLVSNTQMDDVEAWLRAQAADVVLLQETYHDIGARLADVYPYSQPDPFPEGGQDKQILSRYPMLERSTNNGFDRVVISVDGQQIAVYNIHFGVPFASEPRHGLGGLPYPIGLVAHYDESQRNAQIEGWLAAVSTETLPVIVGGDFNMSDNSLMYSRIADTLNDSFRETESGLGTTWPSQTRGRRLPIPPVMRIDYIWHTDVLRTLDVFIGPNNGSDHRPVVATLALPE